MHQLYHRTDGRTDDTRWHNPPKQ